MLKALAIVSAVVISAMLFFRYHTDYDTGYLRKDATEGAAAFLLGEIAPVIIISSSMATLLISKGRKD
jgi:hypothetical protein